MDSDVVVGEDGMPSVDRVADHLSLDPPTSRLSFLCLEHSNFEL